MIDTSFCCLECRLLQAAGTACCECGSPAITALASGSELLKYRNMQVAEPPGAKTNVKVAVGSIAGMAAYLGIALSSLVWLPAAPIAAGLGFAGLGAYAWRRKRAQLVAVPTLGPVAADAAVTRRGVARKLTETVPSIVDGAAVLAEEVVVSTLRGVLFRRVAAVPFVVELDEPGEDGMKPKLVVDGTLRIKLPATEHGKLAKGDPRATALGLPASLAKLRGTVETAPVRDGDRIAVTGEIASEIVPALAFHRDAGATDVMRGRAKAVVIVGPDRD